MEVGGTYDFDKDPEALRRFLQKQSSLIIGNKEISVFKQNSGSVTVSSRGDVIDIFHSPNISIDLVFDTIVQVIERMSNTDYIGIDKSQANQVITVSRSNNMVVFSGYLYQVTVVPPIDKVQFDLFNFLNPMFKDE